MNKKINCLNEKKIKIKIIAEGIEPTAWFPCSLCCQIYGTSVMDDGLYAIPNCTGPFMVLNV